MSDLGQAAALGGALADVANVRERSRLRRLRRVVYVLGPLTVWYWVRFLSGNPVRPGLPSLGSNASMWMPGALLVGMFAVILVVPMLAAGRSPHVLYRSSEIETSLDDVRGAGIVKEEVVRTLNLFLAYKTFKETMGGTPPRAILFEGPPGTGKTYMAKAMAREAGVPFLFVSSSAFQSMYYGQTNRKIRSYFKALRAAARAEGGAIGFIEEIDAIGGSRQGMGGGGKSEGITGVVNELLIQLQSFDAPTGAMKVRGWFIERLNALLRDDARVTRPRTQAA